MTIVYTTAKYYPIIMFSFLVQLFLLQELIDYTVVTLGLPVALSLCWVFSSVLYFPLSRITSFAEEYPLIAFFKECLLESNVWVLNKMSYVYSFAWKRAFLGLFSQKKISWKNSKLKVMLPHSVRFSFIVFSKEVHSFSSKKKLSVYLIIIFQSLYSLCNSYQLNASFLYWFSNITNFVLLLPFVFLLGNFFNFLSHSIETFFSSSIYLNPKNSFFFLDCSFLQHPVLTSEIHCFTLWEYLLYAWICLHGVPFILILIMSLFPLYLYFLICFHYFMEDALLRCLIILVCEFAFKAED